MPTVSGFSYRVELVENFHQVLLQLHPDLFALPRQEGNMHEAVSKKSGHLQVFTIITPDWLIWLSRSGGVASPDK